MTYISSKDFLAEVAKGTVPGHSLVHKFGRSTGLSTGGTFSLVSTLGGSWAPPVTASAMRVASGGNVADDATGTGAREITIEGLDATGAFQSEAVATAGTSASSATSGTFIRVFRAYVSSAGTGKTNAGTVVIENTLSAAFLHLATGEGQSQYAAYAVPLATTAYLLSAHGTVDGVKSADVRMQKQDSLLTTIAPFEAQRVQLYYDGISGSFDYQPRAPQKFDALTDIWWEGTAGAAGVELSVNFDLLLVDD